MIEATAASYRSQIKFKSADQVKASDTTLANDNHLTGFAIGADALYLVRGVLFLFDFGGDFKWIFNFDNAPQQCRVAHFGTEAAQNFISDAYLLNSVQTILLLNGSIHTLQISGFIEGHATLDAVMDVQWAQNVSSGSSTNFKAGSHIELVRLS